jgi:hypothetical protein
LLSIPITTPASTAYGYWLFTVTGQLDPSLTIAHGRNHLWRVANLSANVSYLLQLCDAATKPQECGSGSGRHPMTVVSVDGIQAGSSSLAAYSRGCYRCSKRPVSLCQHNILSRCRAASVDKISMRRYRSIPGKPSASE